ncbi:MAG: hypothetical protein JST54_11520 [Deltaproteobacteria bacterium]|nr:hypothetical protein [Deltaproteobacteria bacterium]
MARNLDSFAAAASPGALNGDLLTTLAGCAFSSRVVTLEIGSEPTRTLWLKSGCLVGTASTFIDDRLGEVLASQGKLDAAFIKPIGDAAQGQGRRLGELLCEDKLLTPKELAAALDFQVQRVFVRALSTMGAVQVIEPTRAPAHPVKTSIAAAIVDAFRAHLPLAAAHELLSRSPGGKLIATPAQVQQLALRPEETRQVRELERVRINPSSVANGSEGLARLLAGLLALKLLD